MSDSNLPAKLPPSWLKRRIQKAGEAVEQLIWGAIIVSVLGLIWYFFEGFRGAPMLIAIGFFSAIILTIAATLILKFIKSRPTPTDELSQIQSVVQKTVKGLTAEHSKIVGGLNKRIKELEEKPATIVKEPCPYTRTHVVADTQAQHIDHYVVVTKISTGDQELTADVPSIIFGIEVRNESIFDISIDMDVENSRIYFEDKLLAERKIQLYASENIPPRSPGTLTFEQRLSSPEATFISKNQNEANTKFRFDGLVIFITGGTDYPQVARKALEIPKDIEVNEALPKDLKARIGFLTSEMVASEGRAKTIQQLEQERQSIESQLSRRAKNVRVLGEVAGYGRAIEDKCQLSNMEYPKPEVDEWAGQLWVALRWCFEEAAVEKFYLELDPRCPGYEYGVFKIIKVPEANAERHLWFHYHRMRLTRLIDEQVNAPTNERKEEGQS